MSKSCLYCPANLDKFSVTPRRSHSSPYLQGAWWGCTICNASFLYLDNSEEITQVNIFCRLLNKENIDEISNPMALYVAVLSLDTKTTVIREFALQDNEPLLKVDKLLNITPDNILEKLKLLLVFS
jgi:hypothetical protein